MATANKKITTAAELIEALGGPSAVAKKLHMNMPAVWAWSRNGIAPNHRHHMLALAAKAGIDANEACDLPPWVKIDMNLLEAAESQQSAA